MVDPGGLVGAVSLALQVVQGLKTYYTQYLSYHDDIAAVVTRIKRLESILQIVENPTKKLSLTDDPISDEVWSCIAEGLKTVEKLKSYQEKCSYASNASGIQASRMHEVKKRLAYPFRKDTLEDLQKCLDRLLESHQVIMQALQLESNIRFNEKSESRDDLIHRQLTQVQKHQSYQTECLQSMDVAALQRHLQSSSRAIRVEEHLEAQSTQLTKILSFVEQIGHAHPIGSGSFDFHKASQHPDKPGCPNYYEWHTVSPQIFDFEEFLCRCSNTATHSKYLHSRYIRIFWYTYTRHAMSCPLYLPDQISSTLGVQFLIPRHTILHFVEFALKYSTGFITPQMTYCNVVSDQSPAFRLIHSLGSFFFTLNELESVEPVAQALNLTLRCLLRLVKANRAKLRDINFKGETLFHAVFKILPGLFLRDKHSRVVPPLGNLLSAFLHVMRNLGVPQNERNHDGLTPLDIALYYLGNSSMLHGSTMSGLDRSWLETQGKSYSMIYSTVVNRHWHLKDLARNNVKKDPILYSMLQKSGTIIETSLYGRQVLQDLPFLLETSNIQPENLHSQHSTRRGAGIPDLGEWRAPDGASKEKKNSQLEWGSWEWFQKEVEKIMNG